MELIPAKLRYRKYVTPNDTKVCKEVFNLIYDATISDIIKHAIIINKWIRENIKTVAVSGFSLTPSKTLEVGFGTCFAKAVLLCSMIRSIGASVNKLFVVVYRPKKSSKYVLHASVLFILSEGEALLLDPSADFGIIKLKSMKDMKKLGTLFCIFNDIFAWIVITDKCSSQHKQKPTTIPSFRYFIAEY